MCCTNSRRGGKAGTAQATAEPICHQPQLSRTTRCCWWLPPSSRAPSGWVRHNQRCSTRGRESLGHLFHYKVHPEFPWHFVRKYSDWPGVTQPCLLLALGFIPAALYLPIITRKPRKWIRNHLPPKHLVLGSVLALVRKNGSNTLQMWPMLSAGI